MSIVDIIKSFDSSAPRDTDLLPFCAKELFDGFCRQLDAENALSNHMQDYYQGVLVCEAIIFCGDTPGELYVATYNSREQFIYEVVQVETAEEGYGVWLARLNRVTLGDADDFEAEILKGMRRF